MDLRQTLILSLSASLQLRGIPGAGIKSWGRDRCSWFRRLMLVSNPVVVGGVGGREGVRAAQFIHE